MSDNLNAWLASGVENVPGANATGGSDAETEARRRGFAAMDPDRQREIASMGGKISGARRHAQAEQAHKDKGSQT